ncbi:MAG: bifunctional riboflavin kinase/FAD synthetase [Prevotella sp.]|nr:bifunctional riboflavin kinase/FAD synthetase [Prevotella sp.]
MRIIHSDNIPKALPEAAATVGFFDGVHRGHQHLIGQVACEAEKRGLQTMVVTFDRHPRQVLQSDFQPLLLTSFEEKMERLEKAGVDCCTVLHFTTEMAAMTATDFIGLLYRELRVRCLVVGYDNRFGHNREEGFEDYVRHGAEQGVEVLQSTPFSVEGIRVSSSAIRKMLARGDMECANMCLGRPYTLDGRVVEGFQQGRRLGFPTANLLMEEAKMLPASGAYVARAHVEGDRVARRAVTNIGTRPTFNGKAMAIETYVIDYEGDLYGKHLMVELTHRLREERRFESTALLAEQLREDVRHANAIFDEEGGSSCDDFHI